MPPSKLFVVIPSYNEEENLPALLPLIARVVEPTGHPLQMLVINDGSRDQTRQVAEKLGETLPVRVISHPTNLGVAQVFRTGLRAAVEAAAPSDVIVLMEGDRTNIPELLPEFMRRIDAGDDVVIGSRYAPGGRYHKFPFKRLVLSHGANTSMRFLFPIPHARDYTIFYRAYRAGVLAKGFEILGDRLIETRTFVCNAELLIKLNHIQPLRISEVPLVYRYDLKRGKSKMPIAKTMREYVTFVGQTRRTLRGVPIASQSQNFV
ncbi:MAG TPA: glycosyltransferase [Candidatus Methylacidiphilales bacterium]|nr:glycosyltransferase [Candidatus Methylacidiphilales bacterium]